MCYTPEPGSSLRQHKAPMRTKLLLHIEHKMPSMKVVTRRFPSLPSIPENVHTVFSDMEEIEAEEGDVRPVASTAEAEVLSASESEGSMDYDCMVETALETIASTLLKQHGGDTSACLETIEGIFSVNSPMSWLPCLVSPSIHECTNNEQSILCIIRNFCRLRHILLGRQNDHRHPEDLDWDRAKETMHTSQLPPCEMYKYIYRFNRLAHAENVDVSAMQHMEHCLRLYCADEDVKDMYLTPLPAYPYL
eukprot:comp17528_c0_seq1/m.17077 comp17528_c0_seq1/g.17077  ORF comp17528_c0_seq1/g.17077 comp17528_c0_seq1/m.17077 type:complete len:249 (-) comp17528_c0_seq1:610-1356(-)